MLLQVNTFNLTPKNHVQVQIGSGRKMRIAMMTKTCRRMRKKMMMRKAVGRKMMDLGSWPSMHYAIRAMGGVTLRQKKEKN